jgi:hypothetical protein
MPPQARDCDKLMHKGLFKIKIWTRIIFFGSLTQEKPENLLIKLLDKNLFTQQPFLEKLYIFFFSVFFSFSSHWTTISIHPNVLVSNYIRIPQKILKILEMNYNNLEMLQFHFKCGNGGQGVHIIRSRSCVNFWISWSSNNLSKFKDYAHMFIHKCCKFKFSLSWQWRTIKYHMTTMCFVHANCACF